MGALGIDIGTSSVSLAILGDSGDEAGSLTYSNDSLVKGDRWENLQDAGLIASKVVSVAEDLVSRNREIGAIGLSGQMHGILYVDKTGRAVSPLFTWQDGRGDLPFRDGSSYAQTLSALTGYKLSTGYGLVTHYYNLLNGLVPAEAARICTVMDYAVMALTGSCSPVIDPSNAASLGCFDLESLSFDTDALSKAGIDPSMLPDVSPTPSFQGFFRGIPVATAIGDNQASFLGSVRSPGKAVHVTVGTSSQISVFTKEYSTAPGIDIRPLPGGGYLLVGAALCGGSALALLNGFLGGTARFLTGSEPDPDLIYERMGSVAFRPASESGLSVSTTFRGTREEPSVRGRIDNVSFDNWNIEDLVLGFHRGIADELYSFYETMPASSREGKCVVVGSGNALRRNRLLRETVESRFGLRLELSQVCEEAAFGASLVANRLIHR